MWTKRDWDTWAGLMMAPVIVSARMPILFKEAMSGKLTAQDESLRMVTEKMAAAHEGALAVQHTMIVASIRAGAAMARGKLPTVAMMDATRSMGSAALSPSARRVRANVRRLKKG
jgi:hypothetical protein